MTESESGAPGALVPAFAGQRPPFEPGNLAALKPGHGAYSMRLRQERYDEVLPQIVADYPAAASWWHETFAVYCVAEESLSRAFLTLGAMNSDGEPRARLLHDLRATTRLKLELLREIAATPASAMKVFRDATAARASVVDADAVAEQGRRAREERESREQAAS